MADFSESPGFIRDQKGRLEIEYLPPYAPELNPVEYIWAHCKHHKLPNVCPKNLWYLSEGARRALKRCGGGRGWGH